jgi:uncharacterized membrane protein
MLRQEQTGNLSPAERAWSALIGASLSNLAMRRGSPVLRSLEATAGAALLARALAGHCGIKAALMGNTSLREGLGDQWTRMSGRRTTSEPATPGSPAHAAKSRTVDAALEQIDDGSKL